MTKRCLAFLLALVLTLSCCAFGAAATGETAAAENAGKPEILLSCDKNAGQDQILLVQVSLSGCAGLTSADIKFEYDPKVLTYLGGSLKGAAAADPDVRAAFSDADAAETGKAAVSVFHLEQFSVQEGNGAFCELAFRTGKGSCTVKASVDSFQIDGETVSVKTGKCRYSSGFGSFFRENGSAVFVATIILIVLIVLIVLLVVIRRMKKNIGAEKAQALPFDETEDAGQTLPDETAADTEMPSADDEATEETACEQPAQPEEAESDDAKADETNPPEEEKESGDVQ